MQRPTRPTVRSAGGVCIRASSSMPQTNPDAPAVVWGMGDSAGARGATASSPSARLPWRGRCGPAVCGLATPSPSSYPRGANQVLAVLGVLAAGASVCANRIRPAGCAARQDPADRRRRCGADDRGRRHGCTDSVLIHRCDTQLFGTVAGAGLSRYRRDRVRDLHVRFDGSTQGRRCVAPRAR